MRYVVERSNGNPKILAKDSDGLFFVIAYGAGDDRIPDLVELVRLANAAESANL